MSVEFDAGSCARCRKPMTGHAPVGGGPETRPKPDDIAVCVYCGAVMKFAKDSRLVLMTDDEIDRLDPEDMQVIANALAAIQRMRS